MLSQAQTEQEVKRTSELTFYLIFFNSTVSETQGS